MGTKEIEIKDLGKVVIRELNNDDRELIQNESTEIVGTGKLKQVKPKIGTLNKYTFILGISKAPFFKTDIVDYCTPETLKERFIEYQKINYNIIQTIIQEIADFNNLDEEEFDNLKKS